MHFRLGRRIMCATTNSKAIKLTNLMVLFPKFQQIVPQHNEKPMHSFATSTCLPQIMLGECDQTTALLKYNKILVTWSNVFDLLCILLFPSHLFRSVFFCAFGLILLYLRKISKEKKSILSDKKNLNFIISCYLCLFNLLLTKDLYFSVNVNIKTKTLVQIASPILQTYMINPISLYLSV